jgi:hypothetical protein
MFVYRYNLLNLIFKIAMKKLLEAFFILLILTALNLAVYLFWETVTNPFNFITEQNDSIQITQITQSSIYIFQIKYFTWAIVINLLILAYILYSDYEIISYGIACAAFCMYLFSHYYFNKNIAKHYVNIFEQQNIKAKFLSEPLLLGGQSVGPIITEKIKSRDYPLRNVAILSLGDIHYEEASEELGKILIDNQESVQARQAAYLSLIKLNTNLSKKYLLLFSQLDLKNSVDRNSIRNLELNNEY